VAALAAPPEVLPALISGEKTESHLLVSTFLIRLRPLRGAVKEGIIADLADSEGVKWAAILSDEGFLTEVAGAPASSLEATGSIAPSFKQAAEDLLANWQEGSISRTTVLAEDGVVIIQTLGVGTSLICQLHPGANLGHIRLIVEECCNLLQPLLD
jgi:predicted regulator of Ras-like GTPase activity (Roadblock/LC7/MglB family)